MDNELDNGDEIVDSVAHEEQEFVRGLAQIYKRLKFSNNLQKAMREVQESILSLLDASMFTIYQTADNGKEIIATYKGGGEQTSENEIKVPYSPSSLAGYVALSQRPILVPDVYDEHGLTEIHPRLKWDRTFSESADLKFKSMVVVPIKDGILLGVIQLINLDSDRAFTRLDLKHTIMLAQMLGKQFRTNFQSTQGPFDYLLQEGKLTATELNDIVEKTASSGGFVTKYLMEECKIKADEIGKSLEMYYRVPYMKFNPDITLPMDILDNIGTTYLKNNLWVPISGSAEEVVILMSDPSDQKKITEIQGIINARHYVFRVGLPEHILMYLGGNLEEEDEESGFDDVFKSLEEESGVELDTEEDAHDEDSVAETSAIIQLVNRIIVESDRLNASDIHIEPGKEKTPGLVRVRVDGVCRELLRVPAEHTSALIARIKVISRLDISERRLPQDGKCKLKIRGRALELRVATVPTVNGESAVLRLLAQGSAMPMEKLNLSSRNEVNLGELSKSPHGLLLVVGPTGSGKTTTLHAVLGHINQPETKIWTAEDPVEITQAGLQQVQVQSKIGFTFAAAMRSFLRADPDVILIGEMRDHETAAIAIEASLTGHLVLSTLHTNSAAETITRLLDLGLDAVNFSDALLGVLAQRLMRTLCKDCKEAYKPDDKELLHLVNQYGMEPFKELGINLDEVQLYRKVGCEICGDSGYRGRTGVHELLVGTPELHSLIYNQASLDELREQSVKDGLRTLKQDGIEKIFMGLTDYAQLLRIITE